MSWLMTIPIVGDFIDKVGGAVDKLVTSDEERLKVKAELTSLYMPILTATIEAQKQMNELQVKLAEVEYKSEHWLVWSRRPIIAFLSIGNLIMTGIFKYMDIQDALYFAMLINGLDTGSRGVEKIVDRLKKKEDI